MRLWFFVFLGIGLNAYSQNENLQTCTIAGKIIDSIAQPVEFAQIILQSYQGNFIAFTQSNSKGEYNISFSTSRDSITLMVSRLGYTAFSQKVPTNIQNYTITLRPAKASYLKEITVKDRNPIEDRGDTLSYLVRAFTNGTETNAEDVLAKLPGVTVDKNSGKIAYQGKEISKIMLDGDDLSGHNYKVLSKNLSADWLSEVEVLKHFSDNRLFHGVKQSDEVAINLKLKESAKAPLFGDIMLGGGTTAKYITKSELLFYLKKLKLFTVALSNNTGDDVEEYDMETYASSEFAYDGAWQTSPVLQDKLLQPDFYRQEDFTFHQGHFLSNAMVIKPSKNIKVRSTTTLYYNDIDYAYSDSFSYFLPNSLNFSLTQKQKQNQQPLKLFQDLKITYDLSPHEMIQLSLQYKNAREQLATQYQTNFSDYQQDDNTAHKELLGTLFYANRLNTNWALSTSIKYNTDNLNEQIVINQIIQAKENPINQTARQDNRNIGALVSINGKLKNSFYLQGLIGGINSISKFNLLSQSADNYVFNQYYTDVNLQKTFNFLKLYAGSRLRYTYFSLNDIGENNILLEPTFSVTFNNTWFDFLDFELKGIYNREYDFIRPYSSFSHNLYTTYRSVSSYLVQPGIPVKNDIYALNFILEDNEKTFITANIKAGYTISDQHFSNTINYSNDIVYNKFVQNSKSNTLFSIYSIDKFFPFLHTSLGVSYKNERSYLWQNIEGINAKSKEQMQNVKFIAGIATNKKISISFACKYFLYQNRWLDEINKTAYNNYVLKFIYKYSTRLRFVADVQTVNFKNYYGIDNSFFRLKMNYKTKNKKWEFEAQLNNLLNTYSLKISQVESSYFVQSEYPLRPRFLLVTAKYRFP